MNIALSEHTATRIVAKELEGKGYTVICEPSPEHIPFSLGKYRPDLLAVKGDDNLIVEIKMRETSEPVSFYREIADVVNTHPNWRFLIMTVPKKTAETEFVAEIKNPEDIQQYLNKVSKVYSVSPELSIPYLWNAIVALLRNKAADAQLKYTELTERSLINQLYTQGELSAEQHQALLKWNTFRNQAVHDVDFSVQPEEVSKMLSFVEQLSQEQAIAVSLH